MCRIGISMHIWHQITLGTFGGRNRSRKYNREKEKSMGHENQQMHNIHTWKHYDEVHFSYLLKVNPQTFFVLGDICFVYICVHMHKPMHECGINRNLFNDLLLWFSSPLPYNRTSHWTWACGLWAFTFFFFLVNLFGYLLCFVLLYFILFFLDYWEQTS